MTPLSSIVDVHWEAEEPARVSDSRSHADAARAFADFYDAHVAFVWRTLRGMGVPKAFVADAAQDVFVVVHKKLPRYDGSLGHKTWLFQIVYRVVCEHRRKARRTLAEPLDQAMQLAAPSAGDPQDRHEASSLLSELLAQLDESKRVVLFLAEVEGMTAPEIAAATQTPLNTVYTRLRRAKLELSAALELRRRQQSEGARDPRPR